MINEAAIYYTNPTSEELTVASIHESIRAILLSTQTSIKSTARFILYNDSNYADQTV